jgi:hypothetical protein
LSLALVFKTPEGICMATDSRLTVAQPKAGGMPDLCFLDSATKLWALGPPNPGVAVAFYGTAATGIRSVGSLIKEWAATQGQRKPVEQIALELHAWIGPRGLNNAVLWVAGFDETNPFGRIFELPLPGAVRELHPSGSIGYTLGGQKRVADRLLETLKPSLDLMPLKGTGELAAWLIDVTAKAQGYSLGVPTVGGAAQTALLEQGKGVRLL